MEHSKQDRDRIRAIDAAYQFLTPMAQVQVQQTICWEARNLWWLVLVALAAGAVLGHVA